MKFSVALLALNLGILVASFPLPLNESSSVSRSGQSEQSSSQKTSEKASASGSDKDEKTSSPKTKEKAGNSSSILSSQSYSALQISDGKTGNAASEAAARFKGIDKGDLASVSDADLKLIQGIHDVAEKAEVQGFNPAIKAASGDEAKALQNGKIKNKVLKTSATVLALEIKKAKGQDVDPSRLEKEKAKKAKNIKFDAESNEQVSKGVTFSGSSGD